MHLLTQLMVSRVLKGMPVIPVFGHLKKCFKKCLDVGDGIIMYII